MSDQQPIQVTEPFLPPLEEYVGYLKGIWDRNTLTNNGPLVRELEGKIQEYHQIQDKIICVANGGLGLQIILKAMGIGGEIITTPFSYVATAACPLWEGCTVRLADIEADSLTLDPGAVEAAITPRTEAILATHVFGNPCDVEGLQAVATRHNLALIYDAAHAFGVTDKGRSILEYGDASMVSLHATKVFHAVEGGFVVLKDPQAAKRAEWMRRYGHKGPGKFSGIGINAKMSELHAAMGLANLPYADKLLQSRKTQYHIYMEHLGGHPKLQFQKLADPEGYNHAYFPALLPDEEARTQLLESLRAKAIYARRYFHPSLNQTGLLGEQPDCPNAESIARRIICLPMSSRYTEARIEWIAKTVLEIMEKTDNGNSLRENA